MAKKKKKAAKKAPAAKHERSPFWSYAWAVMLCLLALFTLLGAFGSGGNLPVGLFKSFYSIFGAAAYLMPVALGY